MTEPDNEAVTTEQAAPPVILGDGELCVFDPDYFDPEVEATGVLAIQHSVERGTWVLIGRGGDGSPYTRKWESVEIEPEAASRPRGRLRPVN